MKLVIKSVNLSEKKGTIKVPQEVISLDENGVKQDAHAGSWHRQVSLLGTESIQHFSAEAGRKIEFGEFAENLTTEGVELYHLHPFDRLVGKHIELEVTQIGKKCHGDNCNIFREVGNCVMPKEGIFARVIRGGKVQAGDEFDVKIKTYNALIVTMSDRASRGEYTDKSGPLLEKLLTSFYEKQGKPLTCSRIILPDHERQLKDAMWNAREAGVDLVFVTGGTGIGPRDITPEAVQSMIDIEIPGIMEMIRMKYGMQKPNALLSRGLAGVMGKSLVFAMPGSPKAVNEYCTEIFPILNHSFLMMAGIDGH